MDNLSVFPLLQLSAPAALKIDAFAQPFLAIGLVIAGALQGMQPVGCGRYKRPQVQHGNRHVVDSCSRCLSIFYLFETHKRGPILP